MKHPRNKGSRSRGDFDETTGLYFLHYQWKCKNERFRERWGTLQDLEKARSKTKESSRIRRSRETDDDRVERNKYYREYLSNMDESRKNKRAAYGIQYRRRRKLLDPKYRARVCMSDICRRVKRLKSNTPNLRSTELLGCSRDEFMSYIESKFAPGMSWSNHGKYGWHFDHIIPIRTGNSAEELLRLCHYTNIQPLWASDNLSKAGRAEPVR